MSKIIDINARMILRDKIKLLLADELSWEQFDKYCSSLSTQDKSVIDIAWLFWDWKNPEYPSNQKCLTQDLLIRIDLFLSSKCEYAGKPKMYHNGILFRLMKKFISSNSNADEVFNEYWPFTHRKLRDKPILNKEETKLESGGTG